jgi:Flp pilus assembly pilin Flp
MLLKKMRELFRSEEGATATEYAVMLALTGR